MPISTMPEVVSADLFFNRSASFAQAPVRTARAAFVRRRASLEQGRALETLGHAVEYLVDSRMLVADSRSDTAERQAVPTLMRLSREVFSECPEIVPFTQRVRRWIGARL